MSLSAIEARRQKKRKIPEEVQEGLTPQYSGSLGRLPPLKNDRFSPSELVSTDHDLEQDISVENFSQIPPTSCDFMPEEGISLFQLNEDEASAMSGTNRCRVGVVFTIPQGSYLRFHGHIKLMVISGTVELLGVRIHASPHTHNIFAPCSHPTPSITALNEGNVSEARLLPLRIRDLLPPSATVLGLFPSMTGVESLEQVSPLFRGLFCGRSSNWKIPGLQVEPSAHNVFVLPSSWMQAISQAEKHSDREDPFIGVIHGPKGTGKSTFARTLANSLVQRFGAVAFLDCDPGQSEFSPPGCLSLHLVDRIYLGPPFTHIIKPFIAHYIGSASAKTDPQYYLSCIQSLLGVFATEIQYDAQTQTDNLRAIPLVINTHGWVKGLGADLTRQIISLANPSHVFDLQTSEVVHQHHSPDTAREPLWIPMEAAPLPNPSIKLNAVDLRGLSLMSYFHSRWDMGESTWTTIKPLASMPPWELQPRIALDSIILGGSDGGIVPSSELGNTLCSPTSKGRSFPPLCNHAALAWLSSERALQMLLGFI